MDKYTDRPDQKENLIYIKQEAEIKGFFEASLEGDLTVPNSFSHEEQSFQIKDELMEDVSLKEDSSNLSDYETYIQRFQIKDESVEDVSQKEDISKLIDGETCVQVKMSSAGGNDLASSSKRGKNNMQRETILELLDFDMSDFEELSNTEDDPDFELLQINEENEEDSDSEYLDEDETGIYDENGVGNEVGTTNQEANKQCQNKKEKLKYTFKKGRFTFQQGHWFNPTIMTDAAHELEVPTPFTYFSKYITPALIETIAQQSNMYAMQSKNCDLKTTEVEIRQFIGIHVHMGTLGYKHIRLYWNGPTKVEMIADTMPINRFFQLRSNFHIVDNNSYQNTTGKTDKLWKVRPFLDSVKSRMNDLEKEENMSIDEQVIPFKGHSGLKQYMKNRPSKWGIKNFGLCGASGLMYNFLIFQGKTTKFDNEYSGLGVGASIALQLSKVIEKGHNYKLYFHNFFTSLPLLFKLQERDIYGTGTIRQSRLPGLSMTSDKDMMKMKRGSMETFIEISHDIAITKWLDNRVVTLASTLAGDQPTDIAKRWDKKKKDFVNVPWPYVIKLYDSSVGGVNKMDMLLSMYRIFIKIKKWYLRVLFHFVDVVVVNSWLEYRRDADRFKVPKKKQMTLIQFRVAISEAAIKADVSFAERKRSHPSLEEEAETPQHPKRHQPRQIPCDDVRYDQIGHWPLFEEKQAMCRQVGCKGRPKVTCKKCKIRLCFGAKNCFYSFHNR